MMDEFHLTEDDLKMIKRGKTQAVVETLGRLRRRFRAIWVVTSTTCLLDITSDSDDKVELGPVMSGAGYQTILLPHIMRCSRRIAEATSPSSCNSYYTRNIYKVRSSIDAGSASTVAGTRPTAILHKWSDDDTDYQVLAGCVSLYLDREKINTATSSVAILCDGEISATKLAAKLQLPGLYVYTYTAGVERFYYNSAKYSSKGGSGDTSSVEAWLERGGVLLTHSMQFRGCEADVVILVARDWGYNDGRRSGITRGVASLCLITPDGGWINVNQMKKVYHVIHYNQ